MENAQREEKKTRGPYIALLCISLFIFLFIGPIVSITLTNAASAYMRMHIPYILLFITFIAGSRFILKEPFANLIVFQGKIRWKLVSISALIYLLNSILCSLLFFSDIKWNGISLSAYLLQLLPVIIITPLQALSEEILFRALPLSIAYPGAKPRTIPKELPFILFAGIIFTLPHLWNNEMYASAHPVLTALCYFSWGMLAAFLSLETEGFEASSAMHAVNNLYIALIVNYDNSSMPTVALFTSRQTGEVETLIQTIAVFAFTYLILRRSGFIRKEASIG